MKNNLTDLIKGRKPVLTPTTKPKTASKAAPVKRKSKKPAHEIVSERTQTMLTKTELANLKAKAGDVSVSKYIRSALKRAGELD